MMPAVANTLVLKSELGQLPIARAWAMEHACDAGLGENDLFALELVLSEVVTNVAHRPHSGRPGNDIEVELTVDGERFVLEIRNHGRGGLGMELIDQLMDRVDADLSQPPGTLLRMVRFRTGSRTS